MSRWEPSIGASNEWYTPKMVFAALGTTFDLDVANAAEDGAHVPCERRISDDSLTTPWSGFIWMNPPFGGRNGLVPWMDRFFQHGNGIALTPDRTSAPWWQASARRADAILFTDGKIRFERPDGTVGMSPGSGVTLWAAGGRAMKALMRAEKNGLGLAFTRFRA